MDGGCGGSEVKCEGDAEKAADPAMLGESTTSSCLDGTSIIKKGKKRKSATPSTLTISGLGSGSPARVEADGLAGYNAKAPKVVPRSEGLRFPYPQSWNCRKSPLLSHACPRLLLTPINRSF